jgi:hypothetical protein
VVHSGEEKPEAKNRCGGSELGHGGLRASAARMTAAIGPASDGNERLASGSIWKAQHGDDGGWRRAVAKQRLWRSAHARHGHGGRASEGENGERREQGLGSASPKRRAWERWRACTSKDG